MDQEKGQVGTYILVGDVLAYVARRRCGWYFVFLWLSVCFYIMIFVLGLIVINNQRRRSTWKNLSCSCGQL